jgi:tetratricopeptide (TPR) repeat protein
VALDPLDEAARVLALGLVARHVGARAALKEAEALAALFKAELDAPLSAATRAAIADIARAAEEAPTTPVALAAVPPAATRVHSRVRAPALVAAAAIALVVGAGVWWSMAPAPGPAITTEAVADRPTPRTDTAPRPVALALPVDAPGEARVAETLSELLPLLRRAVNETRAHVLVAEGAAAARALALDLAPTEEGGQTARLTLREGATGPDLWFVAIDLPPAGSEDRETALLAVARAARSALEADAERVARAKPLDQIKTEDALAMGWSALNRLWPRAPGDSAEDHFLRVLAAEPGDRSATVGLFGFHALFAGQLIAREEERHLAEARRLAPVALEVGGALALYFRGMQLKAEGDLQGALAAMETALERDPSFAPAIGQAGHLHALLGRHAPGAAMIESALRVSPRDPLRFLWTRFLGEIALDQGDLAAAGAHLERSMRYFGRSLPTRATVAALLAIEGDEARAVAALNAARAVTPWLADEDLVPRLARHWPADGPFARGLATALELGRRSAMNARAPEMR